METTDHLRLEPQAIILSGKAVIASRVYLA